MEVDMEEVEPASQRRSSGRNKTLKDEDGDGGEEEERSRPKRRTQSTIIDSSSKIVSVGCATRHTRCSICILATCFVSYTHTFIIIGTLGGFYNCTCWIRCLRLIRHLILLVHSCETKGLITRTRCTYSEKGKTQCIPAKMSAPKGGRNNNIVDRRAEGPGHMVQQLRRLRY
jgi:hypothetical protein